MKKKFSILNLIIYFLQLGTFGFGGGATLAYYMHRDLVEKYRWISEDEYKRGFTLSQLAPGPLSAQLAIYIGYTRAKILGATVAGIAFILPSFLLVLGISMVYVRFGEIVWIQRALYGIGAAVIGIIISSTYTLTKRTMSKKILLWLIYFALFFIVVITKQTNILFFVAAGIITLVFYSKKPVKFLKLFSVIGINKTVAITPLLFLPLLGKLFLFFIEAGSLAFGGGLAIIPFLQSGVVEQNHWLTMKQFTDAVAVAMITPGPVVITSAFIGYIVAQIPGSIIATIGIFLPIYLIVILLTPFFHRHASHPHMIAFVEGVTAAAMGAIAGSIILLGKTSIVDSFTLLIALVSLAAVAFFRIPGVIVILLAGVISVIAPI